MCLCVTTRGAMVHFPNRSLCFMVFFGHCYRIVSISSYKTILSSINSHRFYQTTVVSNQIKKWTKLIRLKSLNTCNKNSGICSCVHNQTVSTVASLVGASIVKPTDGQIRDEKPTCWVSELRGNRKRKQETGRGNLTMMAATCRCSQFDGVTLQPSLSFSPLFLSPLLYSKRFFDSSVFFLVAEYCL